MKVKTQAIVLGETIKRRRLELGLGIREVGRLAHVDDSTIVRYEKGERGTPSPKVLSKLAKVLKLPVSELYLIAGYSPAQDLPSMPIYLRTKFKKLPPEAHDEIVAHIKDLQKKYKSSKPIPGENDQP